MSGSVGRLDTKRLKMAQFDVHTTTYTSECCDRVMGARGGDSRRGPECSGEKATPSVSVMLPREATAS